MGNSSTEDQQMYGMHFCLLTPSAEGESHEQER